MMELLIVELGGSKKSNLHLFYTGMRIRFWPKKPDPGLFSNQWRFLKVYKTNILDIKSLLFCFHTFGVRRTIDVLDSENQPESGSGKIRTGPALYGYRGRLTPKVLKQKRRR